MIRKMLAALSFLYFSVAAMASCVCDMSEAGVTGDIVVIGQALPEFSVALSDGRVVTPETFAGRPAVIVFFSTECVDCRKELPVIQRLYEERGDAAGFVCISRAEGEGSVETYWHTHGLTLPYSAQTDREVFHLFARGTIPRVYVCDAEGTVRAAFATKVTNKKLKTELDNLIAKD